MRSTEMVEKRRSLWLQRSSTAEKRAATAGVLLTSLLATTRHCEGIKSPVIIYGSAYYKLFPPFALSIGHEDLSRIAIYDSSSNIASPGRNWAVTQYALSMGISDKRLDSWAIKLRPINDIVGETRAIQLLMQDLGVKISLEDLLALGRETFHAARKLPRRIAATT